MIDSDVHNTRLVLEEIKRAKSESEIPMLDQLPIRLPRSAARLTALAAFLSVVAFPASRADAQTVISQPQIITADIVGDLIITAGSAVTPVILANSLIDGNVTVTNGGFAVRLAQLVPGISSPELTVAENFTVTDGATFVVQRPVPTSFNVMGDFIVEDGGSVNFLPTLQLTSESAYIAGDLIIRDGGGGFFNRMSVLGDVEMDGGFSCFLADSSTIEGSISVTGSDVFSMETTTVSGDVTIMHNEFDFENFPVSIIGTTTVGFANIGFFTANLIEGDLKVKHNTGGFGAPVDLFLGNPSAVTPACLNVALAIESTTVGGNAQISHNELLGSIIISNMYVEGDFKIQKNSTERDLFIGYTGLILDQFCDGTDDLVLVPPTLAPSTVLGTFKIKSNTAGGTYLLGDVPD